MEIIHLRQTLPQVFADRDAITSDVWHQDLVLRKGERYLIEAASGTGKSSLCSYLYGYRRDYQGIINFDERNIRSLSIHEWVELRKHSLSMLFQELRIFPELTALENVQLKNRLTNHKKKKEILSLFETLGIADKADEKAGKLSFGQQQRVAFIRALCQPFDFIFLDEPISHLDDNNSALMGRMLTEEAAKQGAGVVVTSIGKHIELDYNKILKL
ncbi:ATP-binding cassette domain-containing protein [Bacteroides stercorirosoris]|jgi:putative ABC transport system ATP-binding protein|uniref:ATP-binding cassette domain-containing protein n=1 Tax=Bacteroides stercorirosoris TaxID=871324 RepID=A0A413H7Q2_9BACE|nr:ATP-binding cassette domain-containing protein [Bacteroides stercorirosoris]RGX79669.1 ATP-binding cassette domain-containing protein [Bacteroides stercorirosoris]